MVVQGAQTNGMTAGMNSGAFSGAAGLPESFDQYRPPAQFSMDDTSKIPPPAFDTAAEMPDFPSQRMSVPQSKLTGAPLKENKVQSSMFEAAPLPNSMAQQSRPQDHILHMLMESQGGADQIAQINTPVIKERPTGVEPHMVQTNKAGPRGDADMGAYEGHMEGGVRQGSGQCVYKNGNKYEGDWQNNLRHGRGTMHYASSASYDGEWQEGERSGHGVMKYKDGGTYEGQWLRDLKHGYGCFKFASHANYTGQWFEGKMHGQGTYTFADGQKFHGEFDRNLKNGFGTHVYTNGDQWDGVWVGDKPHGAGLYIAYDQPDTKIKSTFIKQGDPIPVDGRAAPADDALRKEDKVRILQEGEEAARKARLRAENAAQMAADARKLMHKVLDDTTTLLGLTADLD
eukprot:Tamp_13448.p1 GENE.Tamp_13448~~Tamp_13448.p1  ORF type:complete len:432 (+),score=109.61 Tamp_13448:99-1298(+)